MLAKIKNIPNNSFFRQFRDTRAIVLAAFAVIAILVTWSGVKAVQTNYGLQKQISELEQKNEIRRLENANLELRNKYLETDQFLELAARRQFGKASPGETELLVPKSVALKHVTETSAAGKDSSEPEAKKPAYQKNFQAWINFFLHRQQTSD